MSNTVLSKSCCVKELTRTQGSLAISPNYNFLKRTDLPRFIYFGSDYRLRSTATALALMNSERTIKIYEGRWDWRVGSYLDRGGLAHTLKQRLLSGVVETDTTREVEIMEDVRIIIRPDQVSFYYIIRSG